VRLLLPILLASILSPLPAQAAEPPGEIFRPGDRVALLGNTFAERLRLGGHFETALQAALPEHRLVVRNLAWSADEVALRPRPLNFGSVEDHLRHQQIDVALLFYGANEAFEGEAGIDRFKTDLGRYLDRLGQVENRTESLRLVLVSPIPHERHPRFKRLPDPTQHNRDLASYSQALHAVAIERNLEYIDLFTPMQELFESRQRAGKPGGHCGEAPCPPLTINSMHLNDEGLRAAARLLLAGLGVGRPGAETESTPGPAEEELRQTVVAKDRLFFDRYRAVNGYYIYGERRRPFGVENFPAEMARFDERVAELDHQIHQLALRIQSSNERTASEKQP
jgi:lysophospholipase L1-like esterase